MVFTELDYEQLLLGGLLTGGDFAEVSFLQPEDFSKTIHQVIFKAMENLYRKNKPLDIALILEECHKIGRSLSIDEEKYLAYLMFNSLGFPNDRIYAEKIKYASNKDKAVSLAGKIARDLTAGKIVDKDEFGKAKEYAEKIEDLAVTQNTAFPEVVSKIDFKELAKVKRYRSKRLSTLTDYVPFTKNEVVYIAGRSSMGKSQFAINLMEDFLEQGAKVLYVSLEMGVEQFLLRLVAWDYANDGLPIWEINIRDTQWKQSIDLMMKQEKYKGLFFVDNVVDIRDIVSKITGCDADVAIVDYIQLVRAKGENRNMELEYIAGEFRRLSRNRLMIVLSQLSRRSLKDDNEMSLEDLRGSGGLEQTASSVIGIKRDKDDKKKFAYKVLKNQTLGRLSDWIEMHLDGSGRFFEIKEE